MDQIAVKAYLVWYILVSANFNWNTILQTWVNVSDFALLWSDIALILKCEISVLLFYTTVNKMKQHITENEENLFQGEKKEPRCQQWP